MKNVSSLKSNSINSPKTPGGISKSLLTPCRRVGLSRNWRKNGPSPFISPLSGNSTEVKEEKKETRKRKDCVDDQNTPQTSQNSASDENEVNIEGNDKTPSRNVEIPRRKKTKTLIATINKSQEDIEDSAPAEVADTSESGNKEPTLQNNLSGDSCKAENTEVVSTPVRTKSKKSKKRLSPTKPSLKTAKIDNENRTKECKEGTPKIDQQKEEAIYTIKEKSPNDLKKECVVVIQRKVFKNIQEVVPNEDKTIPDDKTKKLPEQSDSDSDEAPLINLQKQNSTKSKPEIVLDEDDDDFIDKKNCKSKPIKLSTVKSPKSKLKTMKPSKPKIAKVEKVIEKSQRPSQSSQNCFDDDDDDDFDNKRTILIRKSYDKVVKPLKAKSTGSITQKDIDNLRNRIEAKKKLLLAQSLTPDTEELRSLIKKWQKGCQDALMELLDLMKNKFPDKERMDYSEMLKTLKIPPSLVGYDSENDCFNSPDDASIILGQFKDI